jgi:hypothetical protein
MENGETKKKKKAEFTCSVWKGNQISTEVAGFKSIPVYGSLGLAYLCLNFCLSPTDCPCLGHLIKRPPWNLFSDEKRRTRIPWASRNLGLVTTEESFVTP